MMTPRGADRVFVPREGRVTGALDIPRYRLWHVWRYGGTGADFCGDAV
ncbi:MAG: hypothetical protein O9313_17715 [Acetobacteraceae bacterium]|nr:hypothetical protein [Acetobacteraceae bacterium]